MRRGYTVERYLARIDQLLAAAPDFVLHSDFIVGYPGETEADFAATADLMRRVRFAQSYVFKYSPRPGTVAAALADDVPEAEKERRNQVLLAVQEEITAAQHGTLVGQVFEVLVEGASKVEGRLTGRTVHHRLVHFAATRSAAGTDAAARNGLHERPAAVAGDYVPVRITQALAHSLVGELLPPTAAQEGPRDRAEPSRAGAATA
jgi:tRNA-2-methylthio-N6-dimethylallyladenosine synthase